MDDKTAHALLAHLTAQSEYLGLIARYYATQDERKLVRAIPPRTIAELRALDPEAAALAERIGAGSAPKRELVANEAA